MSSKVVQKILQKEIAQNKYDYNLFLVSAIENSLQQIEYILKRIDEEVEKARNIKITDLKQSTNFDLYVYIRYSKYLHFGNDLFPYNDPIHIEPSRSKWPIANEEDLSNFLSNSLGSIERWKKAKIWFEEQKEYIVEYIKHLSMQLREFDISINKLAHYDSQEDSSEIVTVDDSEQSNVTNKFPSEIESLTTIYIDTCIAEKTFIPTLNDLVLHSNQKFNKAKWQSTLYRLSFLTLLGEQLEKKLNYQKSPVNRDFWEKAFMEVGTKMAHAIANRQKNREKEFIENRKYEDNEASDDLT